MSAVLTPTPEELQKLINEETRVIVLNFSATWCGPCQMSAPHVEAFAAAHPEAVVVKIDVDAHQDVASRFRIRSVPTFISLRDGNVLQMHTGSVTVPRLERMLAAD